MSKSLTVTSPQFDHCSPVGISHDPALFRAPSPLPASPLTFTTEAPRRRPPPAGRPQPSSWLGRETQLASAAGLDVESVAEQGLSKKKHARKQDGALLSCPRCFVAPWTRPHTSAALAVLFDLPARCEPLRASWTRETNALTQDRDLHGAGSCAESQRCAWPGAGGQP